MTWEAPPDRFRVGLNVVAKEDLLAVEKVIECPCGAVLEGTDDTSLVENAQVHARETHAMVLSAAQALAMARPI